MVSSPTKRIRRAVPDWNTKVITAVDFEGYCKKEGIRFESNSGEEFGEYLVFDSRPIISVNGNLTEPLYTWVRLHLLGHHLLNYPAPGHFSKGLEGRFPIEANLFSTVAMMPSEWLEKLTLQGEITFCSRVGLLKARLGIRLEFGV